MKKIAFFLLSVLGATNVHSQQANVKLIVGTYTNTCESNGIYVYDFNLETAESKLLSSTEKVINPSFVTVSPDKKFVYSVNENGKESAVSSFYFDKNSGNLEFLGQQDSKGADPCHIINDDQNVIVANYSGGTISVFGKNKFGALNEAKQVIKHDGKSINNERQSSPHVHMVQFSPDKKYVFSNDLGTDRMDIYSYNSEAEKPLTPKDAIGVVPGSGPRHLVFSPNGKFVYLVQELYGMVTAFSYHDGTLRKIDQQSLVPHGFIGEMSAADIHISAGGKFLYATNRGAANDISCFEILPDGKLKLIERVSTTGKGPRNFAIDPSGNFLLAAHQYSNDVVIFKIDKTTGKLTDYGKKIELCSPVCLVFVE